MRTIYVLYTICITRPHTPPFLFANIYIYSIPQGLDVNVEGVTGVDLTGMVRVILFIHIHIVWYADRLYPYSLPPRGGGGVTSFIYIYVYI